MQENLSLHKTIYIYRQDLGKYTYIYHVEEQAIVGQQQKTSLFSFELQLFNHSIHPNVQNYLFNQQNKMFDSQIVILS